MEKIPVREAAHRGLFDGGGDVALGRAFEPPVQHQHAEAIETIEERDHPLAARDRQDEVHAAAAGQSTNLLHDVPPRAVHDRVGALLAREGAPRLGAHHADDALAGGFGELHQRRADTARGRHHQH